MHCYILSPLCVIHVITLLCSSIQQEHGSVHYTRNQYKSKCYGGTFLSNSVCLPKGYNRGQVPKIPTIINMIFEINNIREIDNKKMTVAFEFYLELTLTDNRILTNFSKEEIQMSGAPLSSNRLPYIWTPDLWIQNLVDFKPRSVMGPSIGLSVLRIESCTRPNCALDEKKFDTAILFNFEARATVFCNFKFFSYPMDTQTCDFVMSSAYPFPNVIEFKLQETRFGTTFNSSNTDDFVLHTTFNAILNRYSGISCVLKMERCLLPYIMKYYLPCIAMVIVSLISFLLALNTVPARVVLLVTLFLTLTNTLIAQQVRLECILLPQFGQFTLYCLSNEKSKDLLYIFCFPG